MVRYSVYEVYHLLEKKVEVVLNNTLGIYVSEENLYIRLERTLT
jgi:hypothetical protein